MSHLLAYLLCLSGMFHSRLLTSDSPPPLSLESITVLNDALSQIESQGNISMNSTSSGSAVSSSVDTVSTSVCQMHSKFVKTLSRDTCVADQLLL